MPRAILAGFILLAGVTGAAADDATARGAPITDPAEITELVAGKTLGGVVEETGWPWTEFYCDTGRTLYEFGDRISRGKWWTERGKICFSYEYDDYLIPKCFDLYGRPDGSLVLFASNDEGEPRTFLSTPPVAGDPLHLEERALNGCALEPSV